MQRKVLDYLYNQGGLTLIAYPGESKINFEALQKFALALNAGARFIVVDLSTKYHGDAPITSDDLFQKILTEKDLENFTIEDGCGYVLPKLGNIPEDEASFRVFFHNLELLKKKVPHIVAILPSDEFTEGCERILSIARLFILSATDSDEAAAYLTDVKNPGKIPLLWCVPVKPNRKKFPKVAKAVCKNKVSSRELKGKNFAEHPEDYVQIVKNLHKIHILKKNPIEGFSKLFLMLLPLFLIIAFAIPFAKVTKVEASISNGRDRIQERNHLSVAPSFEFTFNGTETMQRIGRYAIGRFSAIITTERMVQQYVETTLEENGYPTNSWKQDKFNIPPEGTIIKFSRPDNLGREAADSIGAAWKYWTSIVSDSIAYLTEFYHKNATSNIRLHHGIDLASKKGARILAPFSAKAWTSRDANGGTIIALVREKDVILFMHCDQLLYLDGQEVMPGDPIATIGLTGRTTGPHAHIVTGLVSKNGDKAIGGVKYKVIDPMEWFYKFKPTPP